MYNVAISFGAAVAGYVLGWLVAGWLAGFIPAILAFAAVFILLGRRTMQQVEAVAREAMADMQAGRADAAKQRLLAAIPLGRWQFLVAEQLYGQVGMIDYMQAVGLKMQRQLTPAAARLAEARSHLEKSWTRDWRARAALAIVHHREGRVDDAVKVFEGASGGGAAEPMFWGLWAHVLNEAKRRDEALKVVGRGLEQNKGSAPLVEVQEALSNRKRPAFKKAFGEAWFQYFPDDMSQEELIAMHTAATGKPPPGAPGGGAPKGRSPKTWPMPRR
jgi:tetratricopeptide (TPR) repeat protein